MDYRDDGVYEIREFIDDSGAVVNHEILDVKGEFETLKKQFAKVKLEEEDKSKKEQVDDFLNKLNADFVNEDDFSAQKIGVSCLFVNV